MIRFFTSEKKQQNNTSKEENLIKLIFKLFPYLIIFIRFGKIIIIYDLSNFLAKYNPINVLHAHSRFKKISFFFYFF